jgi:hypothetical protein
VIEVKVFGAEPPCVNCKRAEEEAKKAATAFPGQVTVRKVWALSPEGLALELLLTPAVMVNGTIVSQGRVPLAEELERIYRSELGG